MILYAVTIFLSAFLLFQVQPLIAKIILPWFGGSAAVWSAALMFFQLCLLAGYAYAHLLIRYAKPRIQMPIHGALLLISAWLLPILPNPYWKPVAAGDPTFRILALLATSIGLQYFLLSSTSPLLQAWFVRRSGAAVPYRLFALSNFGSMLALVSFPFLVEPQLSSRRQAYGWSGAYVAFALLCAVAAWRSREESSEELRIEPVPEPAAPAQRPGFAHLLLWVSLAACASTLLVSITNHLSQNVAPIPLLWVLPLALYLLTFILAFESDRIYQRWLFLPWLAPALAWMAHSIYTDSGNLHIRLLIPIFSAGLFVCCMMCHGELAQRKPAPQYLTLFYLMVSLGGAIGGIFVALIAPRVFSSFLELQVGLVVCGFLAVIVLWNTELPKVGPWPARAALIVAVGYLGFYLGKKEFDEHKGYRLIVRNFYGVLHVRDEDSTADQYAVRSLLHGTINHGSQLLRDEYKYQTTSYYAENSGVGRALRALQARGPIRYGVIGLGAGVLSNYARAQDYVRMYDINPLVEKISQIQFSFYPHSPADKRIMMGDARLVLESQENQNFDLIAVDAFSSDAIPIHLLTREAFALYFRQLKPNGILALHISNRYLDLAPVCAAGARYLHKAAQTVSDDGTDGEYLNSSTWVLVTADENWFSAPSMAGADMHPPTIPPKFRDWTDDYSNIVQILSLK